MGRANGRDVVGKVLMTGTQTVCLRCLGGWAGTSLRWGNPEAGVGRAGGFEGPLTYPSGGLGGSPLHRPDRHESILAGDSALGGTSMGGSWGVVRGPKTEGNNTFT